MKIKFTKTIATPNYNFTSGTVCEVANPLAQSFIKMGIATSLEKESPKEERKAVVDTTQARTAVSKKAKTKKAK